MFIFEILNCKSSCFSNITGAIDLAFVDRADIKQYIGPPSQPAIYKVENKSKNKNSRSSNRNSGSRNRHSRSRNRNSRSI